MRQERCDVTKEELVGKLSELVEDEESMGNILLLDGFEDAFVGVTVTGPSAMPYRAVYDYDKMLEIQIAAEIAAEYNAGESDDAIFCAAEDYLDNDVIRSVDYHNASRKGVGVPVIIRKSMT